VAFNTESANQEKQYCEFCGEDNGSVQHFEDVSNLFCRVSAA
jgi:hypothetical protein